MVWCNASAFVSRGTETLRQSEIIKSLDLKKHTAKKFPVPRGTGDFRKSSELRRSDFSLRLEDGTVLYIPKLKFAGVYRHCQEFLQGHNMP